MKKLIVLIALFCMLAQQQVAHAQALPVILQPVFSGVVNKVIGSGVMANLARRGITVAANDAVFANTLSAIGKAANDASYLSTAVGVVATVAGAPVWLSAALSLGVVAAAGGLAWGTYKLTQNGTNPIQSISLTPATGGGALPEPVPQPAGSFIIYDKGGCNPFVTNNCPVGYPAASTAPNNLPYTANAWQNAQYLSIYGVSGMDLAQQTGAQMLKFSCVNGYKNCVLSYQSKGMMGVIGGQPTEAFIVRMDYDTDVGGHAFVTGNADPMPNYSYVKPVQPATGNLSALPVTSPMLAEKFPPAATAALADSLWRNAAAQPGYSGYPYQNVTPVSQADIATAPVAPTWSDVVQGTPRDIKNPIDQTVPIPNPVSSPAPVPDPGTDPTTPSTPDMCAANPLSSACAPLGSAPAAPPIPGSSANVSMKPWDIGPSSGTCPAPVVVTVLDKQLSLSFDPICSFVSKLRPLVLALGALAAAFIVVTGIST